MNLTDREQRRKQAEQEALKTLNRIMGEYFKPRASYRYYSSKSPKNKSRAKDMYFYTIAKQTYLNKPRYISGIYRYNSSTGTWKILKRAGHVKKKDAIARAKRLSNISA